MTTAVRAVAAGGPASLSRFRGALVAAVLGDCVGGEFEGAEEVPMERVLQHLNSLDDETKGNGGEHFTQAKCPGDRSVIIDAEARKALLGDFIPSEYRKDFYSSALLRIWLCCIFRFLRTSRAYCKHTLQTKFRSVYT